MTVEIEIAQTPDAYAWNTIVNNSDAGTIFHNWDWLQTTSRHTRSKLYPLVIKKDKKPIGIFPIFFQKRGIVRMVFSPPPNAGLFYLGPVLVGRRHNRLGTQETDYLDLQKMADSFIREEINPDYVSISLSPGLTDPRPYTWAGYMLEPHYDYVTDLTRGEDNLLASLTKRQRQDLNRSIKHGVIVETGGKAEYETILDLMDNRYQDQARVTTVPRSYLLDIYDQYRESIVVLTARVGDDIVTGLVDLKDKNSLNSWIGNPRPRMEHIGSPNLLVAWEAIKYGCQNQFGSYVTMSAAGNIRLHSYYSTQFDPKLKTRFLVKKMSMPAAILETGYSSIFKPVRDKIQAYRKQNF